MRLIHALSDLRAPAHATHPLRNAAPELAQQTEEVLLDVLGWD